MQPGSFTRPEIARLARNKLSTDAELAQAVHAMSILVDLHVGRWALKAAVDFTPGHDGSDDWLIVVVRFVSLPAESLPKYNLAIEAELSSLLASGGETWGNPQWGHVSYRLEPEPPDGAS